MGEASWLNIGSPQPYVVRMPVGEKPSSGIWQKIETSSDTTTRNYFESDFMEEDGFGFREDVELLNPRQAIYKIQKPVLINSVNIPKVGRMLMSWKQRSNRGLF